MLLPDNHVENISPYIALDLAFLDCSYRARSTPVFEEGQQYDVDFRRIRGEIARDPLDSSSLRLVPLT